MSENPFRYRKNLDLHKSEWRHEKKREPIFGPNALVFFVYLATGLVMAPIARFIVIDVLGW